MPDKIKNSVELLSMNSISKGLGGECGLRGGYMEATNLDDYASEMLYKLKSIELCANTIGQVGALLLVDPPRKGVESDSTVEKYQREMNEIYKGLKERALLLAKSFNEMKNVSCSEV